MHGSRRRAIPKKVPGHLQYASEQKQAAWREQVRGRIEREPTWGAYLERRYAREITRLEERFGR